MDDKALRALGERLAYLRNLQARREEVTRSIDAQGKLTDEHATAVENAVTLAELGDVYRPYKQKRRTRATVARERGLEPLAILLFAQGSDLPDIYELAAQYINPEKEVNTAEDALAGAYDIIAELISDSADIRKKLRGLIAKNGSLVSAAAKEDDSVYQLYYDFTQPISKLQGHQILAINRGEKEEFLKVSVVIDRTQSLNVIKRMELKPGSKAEAFVTAAIEDGYDRLLFPSLEREIRRALERMPSGGLLRAR